MGFYTRSRLCSTTVRYHHLNTLFAMLANMHAPTERPTTATPNVFRFLLSTAEYTIFSSSLSFISVIVLYSGTHLKSKVVYFPFKPEGALTIIA